MHNPDPFDDEVVGAVMLWLGIVLAAIIVCGVAVRYCA